MLGFLRAVLSRLQHQQVQPGEHVLGLDEVDVCEVVHSVRRLRVPGEPEEIEGHSALCCQLGGGGCMEGEKSEELGDVRPNAWSSDLLVSETTALGETFGW